MSWYYWSLATNQQIQTKSGRASLLFPSHSLNTLTWILIGVAQEEHNRMEHLCKLNCHYSELMCSPGLLPNISGRLCVCVCVCAKSPIHFNLLPITFLPSDISVAWVVDTCHFDECFHQFHQNTINSYTNYCFHQIVLMMALQG